MRKRTSRGNSGPTKGPFSATRKEPQRRQRGTAKAASLSPSPKKPHRINTAVEAALRARVAKRFETALRVRRQLLQLGARSTEISIDVVLRVEPWEQKRLVDIAHEQRRPSHITAGRPLRPQI